MDTDELAAQWLNNWVADSEVKPNAGDAFVAALLRERTVLLKEGNSPLPGPLRELSPAELAHRLLAQRKAMAARTARFPQFVENANMSVRAWRSGGGGGRGA
jgi:hypothetical protein